MIAMKQTLKSRARSLIAVLLVLAVTQMALVGTVNAANCTWTHRVRFGDSLGVIAQQYGTNLSRLMALNPQITNANIIVEGTDICVSDTETPPPLFGTIYRVTFGDTLAGLAQRFGTTLAELARANGIGNANLIRDGETITVPEQPVAVEPAS
jgi:LysM repeat protein